VKYVLDTNAVSALMRADAEALGWLRGVARSDVAVPGPVVAEIAYGLARLPRSKKRRALEARWELFASELPRAAWTDAVSLAFGKVKASLEKRGRAIEDFDVAIAAHALAHDATLVSTDRKHMPRVAGLLVEAWPVE
jgi:tRNA(fMet)-specific endonuclease VapC